jgi:hypothetical protein
MAVRGLVRGVFAIGILGLAAATACGGGGGGDGPGGNPGDPSQDGGFGFGDGATQGLTIDPPTVTIDVDKPGITQQFKAYLASSKTQVTDAKWAVDVAAMGTVDANGLFTASGRTGGTMLVRAVAGSLQGQASLTVNLKLLENAGNIDEPTRKKLEAGGNADPAFKWLYPYDKTVFPRGLQAPSLQFSSNAEAYYLHVTAKNLDYKGFFKGAAPSRIDLSADLWKTITLSAAAKDPVTVEVTKIAGGAVAGPIKETWTIAQGSLKGVVYYNSYDSKIAGNTGAVMRIKPGANAEVLLGGTQQGCIVCHSVSANGTVLIAAHHGGAEGYTGGAWELKANANKLRDQPNAAYTWGGLYPDGSLLMSNGVLPPSAQTSGWGPNVPGVGNVGRPSRLMDPRTGQTIAAPGWDNAINIAQMPMFSPDGKKIAFNRYDTGKGHTLSVMDFDVKTRTFSNLVDVANDPALYLGWPAFTPDSKYVVMNPTKNNDYATWQANKGDLSIVHLGSKTVAKLDRANGSINGQLYLPHGAGDASLNYEPTILPEAVGGYFWVVFTSRRNYGNTIVTGNQDDGPRKKLWVAAIDIDPQELPRNKAEDISHPAFYLNGQELASGNMRGFWSLDACIQTGNACEPGVDSCCNGFCRQNGSTFSCVPEGGCSQEGEKCETAADCCGYAQGATCLNNRCAKPTPR